MTKIYICGNDTHVSPYESGDPENVTAEVLAAKRAEYAVWLAENPPVDEPPMWTQETLSTMTNAELSDILDSYGISAGGMAKATMITVILLAQGGDGV